MAIGDKLSVVMQSDRAVPNGIATLDESGKLAQMPTYGDVGAAPAVESVEHPGCYYRTVDGVVKWVNPPMHSGVEYRTTERHNGKTVYTILVDCGTMPNTGIKAVAVPQIPAEAKIVQCDVFCYKSTVGEDGNPVELAYTLPMINTFSIALYQWWNTLSNTFQCLMFNSDRDMSGFTGYAIVKYTKD